MVPPRYDADKDRKLSEQELVGLLKDLGNSKVGPESMRADHADALHTSLRTWTPAEVPERACHHRWSA